MKQCTAEQFLKDVANHEMHTLLTGGMYRHLRFTQPKSSNMWFELVTWPGCLTIKGDMGCWTFARIPDMFAFFRARPGKLEINASYWSEKIQSESRFGGPHKQFIPEVYRANVIESLDGYGLDGDDSKPSIIEALNDMFDETNEWEPEMRCAVRNFQYGEVVRGVAEFQFSDSWEISGNDYTYHFLWCLYAIVWGIQQYDAAKAIQCNPVSPSAESEAVQGSGEAQCHHPHTHGIKATCHVCGAYPVDQHGPELSCPICRLNQNESDVV